MPKTLNEIFGVKGGASGAVDSSGRKSLDSIFSEEPESTFLDPTLSTPTQQDRSFWQKAGGVAKGVGNALISSEKGVGNSLAAGIIPHLGSFKEAQKADQDAFNNLQKIAQMIKDKKAKGEDASRLIEFYRRESGQPDAFSYEEINPASTKSNKQALGEVAGVGLDILSAGSYGQVAQDLKALKGGAKVAEIVGKTGKLASEAPTAFKAAGLGAKSSPGIIKGAVQGAKQAAKTGAVLGGAYGVVEGLKEDKDLKGIAISGIKGIGTGAATGAVVGGVTGGIKGGIEAAKDRKYRKALESIVATPKELTPTEYEAMVKKGLVTPRKGLAPAQIVPTKEQERLAREYQRILSSSDPVKNADKALSEIKIHDAQVGQYLDKKKIIYNTGELRNFINSEIGDISDIMVPNQKALDKAKKNLVDELIKNLDQNDLKSLWTARKNFDQIINSQLKAFDGNPTLKKNIAVGVRNAAQDFITKKLGNNVYSGHMKEMTNLFRIIDMVDDKAAREKGLNFFQVWLKNNPGKAQILKGGAAAGTTAGTLYWLLHG